ncbi:MAG TPA: hypothetical protein VKU02_05070 [Gemmataceae bacterium]|nr:hypothetical protein [Gemmataceae bacterium]
MSSLPWARRSHVYRRSARRRDRQDRWVKELRLTRARTCTQPNTLLEQHSLPQWQQRFTLTPGQARDAHRALGAKHNLAAILSIQARRVVANDYTIRFQNRLYQGGTVVVEWRLDGTMAIRMGSRYVNDYEISTRREALGIPPQTREFHAFAADARRRRDGPSLG